MNTLKFFICLLISFTAYNLNAMEPWSHIELGLGYVESELENTENNNLFNYSGQSYSLFYNHLMKSSGNWHQYYGLNIQYAKLNNNADNSTRSEKATHLSPGLNYKIYYKNIFMNLGYNYSMADHEGSGERSTDLDFDIHKANVKVGYDYPVTEALYLMAAYNFSYGITIDLDDNHLYMEHIFSINFLIRLGSGVSSSAASSGGRKGSTSRSNNNKSVDKRNKLYNFFITTD